MRMVLLRNQLRRLFEIDIAASQMDRPVQLEMVYRIHTDSIATASMFSSFFDEGVSRGCSRALIPMRQAKLGPTRPESLMRPAEILKKPSCRWDRNIPQCARLS